MSSGTSRLLALFACPLIPSWLAAQTVVQRSELEYPVKFVCGHRTPSTGAPMNAVSEGIYFTAINIHNASRDSITITTRIASTMPGLVEGTTRNAQALYLGADKAIEYDCADILRASGVEPDTGFLKGFAMLTTNRLLDVVAVYTAGPGRAVATMEIERVSPRRLASGDSACDCPDLTIGRTGRPRITANHHTVVDVTVGNIGCVPARDVVVYMEDPNHTGADRIVTTTIPMIPAGGSVVVSLELPYEVQGNTNMASLVVIVDPKELIRECREDNNRRTVGSP